ncbi:bromodomain adjacent to zinc finger domain protein 2A-like isoform X2 [Acipenser ruthenus]|nr:bromodomain adjacent to zinc finger domain protein 2A-like isoform X2 [Acipenser ruthenus]XP_058869175.1 bromodomain adjacent to zinc finger domain protein 2A-like isoform X2 [Acipenser ruthenus]XP_058869176.1 bromodomain adjacent to zinc finger domain protein 2A-like isoform X2 [Acipenser ruthenus]
MEANNHYNYSGHSSMSASSGLKRSSGETLYTNGSTMSFPQQGKNLNGEMNVNGITTAIGTSGSGSLPSTAYSLMGNHHQPNLGYDYLWDLAQYPSAMGGGTHHKDSPAGVATQQHFQGHGQYQLNGGVGMRQPPNTAAIPGRVGQQFWGGNATNSQQQNSSPSSLMNFNSHGMYAAYQSQPHAPTPQQHQHYGMVPNGLPYYTVSQPQPQMMPAAVQTFASSQHSPQQQQQQQRVNINNINSISNSLPSQAPPAVAVSPPVTGTPENRAVSIGDSTVGASQPLVGPEHLNDVYEEANSYNGMEKKAAAASPCAEPEAFLPEPALEKPLNDSSVIDDSLNSTSDNMASVHSSSEKDPDSDSEYEQDASAVDTSPQKDSSCVHGMEDSDDPSLIHSPSLDDSNSFNGTADSASFNAMADSASFNANADSASFNAMADSASFNANADSASFNVMADSVSFNDTADSASFNAMADDSSMHSTSIFNTTTSSPVNNSQYESDGDSEGEEETGEMEGEENDCEETGEMEGQENDCEETGEMEGQENDCEETGEMEEDCDEAAETEEDCDEAAEEEEEREDCDETADSPLEPTPEINVSEKEPVQPSPSPAPSPLHIKEEEEGEGEDTPNGRGARRRIASEQEVRIPLLYGWRREIRIKKSATRLKGETWYYAPCGKRMKQFPEVIKYLNRHQTQAVTRDHFSFSPRMPVGDYFEERETPEGLEWFQLTNEEIPSMIQAITGKRGRPRNLDKEKPKSRAKPRQRKSRGRPAKTNMVDLLSKVDARLLKKLEAQETLSDEDKVKLGKIKKKMKRKARDKRKQDAKTAKLKQEQKKEKQEKAKEKKEKAAAEKAAALESGSEPPVKKRRQRKRKADKIKEEEEAAAAKEKEKDKGKAKVKAARKVVDKKVLAQRRQEERKRQQLILEELKKPTEDMCITDHQPLPEFSRIPGLVMSGRAFSDCLMIVEFLHSYGKVLGFDVARDIPTLSTLQEGLLNVGDSLGEVQDLLVKLVQAALHDPGLPQYYQSVKILGEKLSEIQLNRSSVSEGLRIFLEGCGFEPEICDSLQSKPFQVHPPEKKAAILAFLVNELNGSNTVISEIDKTLENMSAYRKNKWIIEGKLRRLKMALAKKTGRSELELSLEERRRSARVAEEETLDMEEGVLQERGARRAHKEEAKLSEGDSPSTASVPELERQIDKLTKRQVFFRKKLLHSSQSLRALSLGQDRYRRRYWVLPHIGGVLVEGPEEIQASEEPFMKEESLRITVPVMPPVKKEPKPEVSPPPPPPPPLLIDTPDLEAPSLMNSPRARGRPRKIKPEVELHLKSARRRRRSSKATLTNGLPEESLDLPNHSQQDLNQSAFLSWLSQTQGSLQNGTDRNSSELDSSAHTDSVKEAAEKQGQWFNLLPKTPCEASSSDLHTPSKDMLPRSPLTKQTRPRAQSTGALTGVKPAALLTSPQVSSTPAQRPQRRRRSSPGCAALPLEGPLGFSLPGLQKRRGRPPTKFLKQVEQKYFTQLIAQPIPYEMTRGWWWIKDPEELKALLQVLHPRGIREKALHKHLSKHLEYLSEVCTRPKNDPIFQFIPDEASPVSQETLQKWSITQRALETDLSVLQWVEDLEQRVLAADLQLKMVPNCRGIDNENCAENAVSGTKGWTCPDPDSTREDLVYFEHPVDPLDDWIIKTKKELCECLRVPTHPLDLAVQRLANLEHNIERRYLKEPLWNLNEVIADKGTPPPPPSVEDGTDSASGTQGVESEITPRLRLWRQALDRCRSGAQVSLCIQQLERAIAWERSIVKVTCLVCRKGDNDEYLLLCDGCDRGCHMYCLRPKITDIPEGDWFCPVCVSKVNGGTPRKKRSPKQSQRGRKRRGYSGRYESSDSSEEEDESPRGRGMQTRRRDPPTLAHSRFSGDNGLSPAKRRRMTTRNQPDLAFCEIILMEMESHDDAWPFLEPVNPRLVPGYRKIIKNPMDFLSMREKLLHGGYCSCEEFSEDAQLVFDNCQLFNEDTSEVGMAGHSMRKFFENRWDEFYQAKK